MKKLLQNIVLCLGVYASDESLYVEVGMGEMKYSKILPVVSRGVVACSAVILDADDSAVIAHICPENYKHPVNTENVADKMIDTLKQHGLDTAEASVYIHASGKSEYEKIAGSFKKHGISILLGRYVPENTIRVRDIGFDPVSNKVYLDVKDPYKSFKK